MLGTNYGKEPAYKKTHALELVHSNIYAFFV